jgi:hypothetical protein
MDNLDEAISFHLILKRVNIVFRFLLKKYISLIKYAETSLTRS